MALLFSLENLLTEEGMDSIGKDFKVQQYTHTGYSMKKIRSRNDRDHPDILKSLKCSTRGTALI
jgi:hypothetical protein